MSTKGGTPVAVPSGSAASAPGTGDDAVTVKEDGLDYLVRMANSFEEMCNLKAFGTEFKAAPTATEAKLGGYSQLALDDAVSKNKSLEFTGSFASLNILKPTDDAVHVDEASTNELFKYHFEGKPLPDELPFRFLIAAPMKVWQAQKCHGTWRLLSPIEEAHAVVKLVLHWCHDPKAMVHLALMLKTNCKMEIRYCPAQKLRKESFKFREGRFTTAKATVFSARQRMELVNAERRDLLKKASPKTGKITDKVVADALAELSTAPGLDKFNVTFVNAAAHGEQVFANQRSKTAYEGYFHKSNRGGPLDSVYKFAAISNKCHDDEKKVFLDKLGFFMELLVDRAQSSLLDTTGSLFLMINMPIHKDVN